LKKAQQNQNLNTHTQYQQRPQYQQNIQYHPSPQYSEDSFLGNGNAFENNYAGSQPNNASTPDDGVVLAMAIISGIVSIAILYFLFRFLRRFFLEVLPSVIPYAIAILVVGGIIKFIYNRFTS